MNTQTVQIPFICCADKQSCCEITFEMMVLSLRNLDWPLQVVFEAVRGKNYLGDISLDDIAVKDASVHLWKNVHSKKLAYVDGQMKRGTFVRL